MTSFLTSFWPFFDHFLGHFWAPFWAKYAPNRPYLALNRVKKGVRNRAKNDPFFGPLFDVIFSTLFWTTFWRSFWRSKWPLFWTTFWPLFGALLSSPGQVIGGSPGILPLIWPEGAQKGGRKWPLFDVILDLKREVFWPLFGTYLSTSCWRCVIRIPHPDGDVSSGSLIRMANPMETSETSEPSWETSEPSWEVNGLS